MVIEKVTNSPSPDPTQAGQRISGFLTELKSILADHADPSPKQEVATAGKTDVPAASPKATTGPMVLRRKNEPKNHVPREIVRDPWFKGPKSGPKNHVSPEPKNLEKSSTTGDDGYCLEINFSYFLRISGTMENIGREATFNDPVGTPPLSDQFHEAARVVANSFLKETGWTGDPIGTFLRKTEDAFTPNPATTADFLKSVVSAGDQGPRAITALFNNPGTIYQKTTRLAPSIMADATSDILLRRNHLRPAPFVERNPIQPLPCSDSESISIQGRIFFQGTPGNFDVSGAAQAFLKRFVEFLDTVERRAGAATEQHTERDTKQQTEIPVANPCLPPPSPQITKT